MLWPRPLNSVWAGLCGGDEEQEEEQASWGDSLEEWELSAEDGGGVAGREDWRLATNRMTEELSSW